MSHKPIRIGYSDLAGPHLYAFTAFKQEEKAKFLNSFFGHSGDVASKGKCRSSRTTFDDDQIPFDLE